jgi:hypothetical protein
MKYLIFTLKALLILIAIASAAIAAPFIVLCMGTIIGFEALNSYSFMQAFAKYKSVLDKVPDIENDISYSEIATEAHRIATKSQEDKE